MPTSTEIYPIVFGKLWKYLKTVSYAFLDFIKISKNLWKSSEKFGNYRKSSENFRNSLKSFFKLFCEFSKFFEKFIMPAVLTR